MHILGIEYIQTHISYVWLYNNRDFHLSNQKTYTFLNISLQFQNFSSLLFYQDFQLLIILGFKTKLYNDNSIPVPPDLMIICAPFNPL